MTVLACPICGSREAADYDRVGTAFHKGRRFDILRCKSHGIGFADAIPHVDHVVGIKPSLDDCYGELTTERDPRTVDFMDRVTEVAPKLGLLHDVGCGNGQLMAEAARRGWVVQGNDIVPSVRPDAGLAFFVGTLTDLSLAPASCDVVTSYCVLPHCIDPRSELTAEYHLLKPGGWLVAEMPANGLYRRSATALYRATGGRWRTILSQLYQPGGHQFTFDPRTMPMLLGAVGFEHVRVESYFPNPAMSLARFRHRPLRTRLVAGFVVRGLALLSRLANRPNHMIVYARKPDH